METNKQTICRIETSKGNITVKLYDETPLHRDNFVKLAHEGFYDGTLFHRVIKNFMIQGGDPESKGAPAGKMLGTATPVTPFRPSSFIPSISTRRESCRLLVRAMRSIPNVALQVVSSTS